MIGGGVFRQPSLRASLPPSVAACGIPVEEATLPPLAAHRHIPCKTSHGLQDTWVVSMVPHRPPVPGSAYTQRMHPGQLDLGKARIDNILCGCEHLGLCTKQPQG